MNGRTILGVLLTLLFTLQFTAFAIVHILQEREHDRYRADNDERRLRFENEMRALAWHKAPDHVWPSSSAIAVRASDLANSGYLYEGRAVLVLLRKWTVEDGAVLWRQTAGDKPTIEFRLGFGQSADGMTILWLEGNCIGTENGRIVITNCTVFNVKEK